MQCHVINNQSSRIDNAPFPCFAICDLKYLQVKPSLKCRFTVLAESNLELAELDDITDPLGFRQATSRPVLRYRQAQACCQM